MSKRKRARRKRAPKQSMDAVAALAIYREAMRLYRHLYREMPWVLNVTYLELINYIRVDGHWPDMEKMEWSSHSRQETLRYLQALEEIGLLNLTERRTRFPIVKMNPEQENLYTMIVDICIEMNKTTVTMNNLLEYIEKGRQIVEFLKELPPSPNSKVITKRLRELARKKLISIKEIKTKSGKEYLYHLLPTAELAEDLIYEDWDDAPWTDFRTLTEA